MINSSVSSNYRISTVEDTKNRENIYSVGKKEKFIGGHKTKLRKMIYDYGAKFIPYDLQKCFIVVAK